MLNRNYLTAIVGGYSLVYLLLVLAWLDAWPVSLMVAAGCCLLITLVAVGAFSYQMWQLIPADQARMTPLQAILRNFIPVYNAYWLYQVLWGFTKDANAYIQRRQLKTPLLPDRLAFYYVTLSLLSVLPYLWFITIPTAIVLITIIVSRIIQFSVTVHRND